jgi:hypothetical protein
VAIKAAFAREPWHSDAIHKGSFGNGMPCQFVLYASENIPRIRCVITSWRRMLYKDWLDWVIR